MTVDTPCPQCGTVFTVRRELVGKRTKCIRCGTAFTIAEMPRASAPPEAPAARPQAPASPSESAFPQLAPPPIITPAPQTVSRPGPDDARRRASAREILGFESDRDQPRFPALRILARGYEVLAAVVLVFALVMLVVFLLTVVRSPSSFLAAVFGSGLIFFYAMLAAISLLAAAQVIRLALQVEQNTRATQRACRQLADHLTAIETEP